MPPEIKTPPTPPEPQALGGVPHKPAVVGVPSADAATSLEEEIVHKEEEMKVCSAKRRDIEEESKKMFSERKQLEEKIAPILLDEKFSVDRILAFEKQRLTATDPHDVRLAETSRWSEEENRRGIEHRKWAIGEELEQLTQKIKEVEHTFKALLAEEQGGALAILELRNKVAQRDLNSTLSEITKERTITESELREFEAERARLDGLLRESVKREGDTIVAEQAVDRKTETARTLYEEQVLAGERHKLEDARKEATQKRWEAEDAIPPVLHSVDEHEKHLETLKSKERDILAKLSALLKDPQKS